VFCSAGTKIKTAQAEACATTLLSHMPATYCEVALPVPLRSAFTYAIPIALRTRFWGSRVLVPFRNRAMTVLFVEVNCRRPDPARVKTVKEIRRGA